MSLCVSVSLCVWACLCVCVCVCKCSWWSQLRCCATSSLSQVQGRDDDNVVTLFHQLPMMQPSINSRLRNPFILQIIITSDLCWTLVCWHFSCIDYVGVTLRSFVTAAAPRFWNSFPSDVQSASSHYYRKFSQHWLTSFVCCSVQLQEATDEVSFSIAVGILVDLVETAGCVGRCRSYNTHDQLVKSSLPQCLHTSQWLIQSHRH